MTSPSSPSSSEPQLLLAIQDETSADLLAHRMSRQGLSPVRAPHGEEAWSQLQSMRFDLVVIEMRLSGLTGLELLKHVPTEAVTGTPRVVLLGQHGNNEEIVRAFELGAAEYIARPFAPEVALARILRFLSPAADHSSDARLAMACGACAVPLSVLPPLAPLPLLIGTVIGLFLLALLFAVIAGGIHVHVQRTDTKGRRLHTAWKGTLLDVLAGDAAPESLRDQVPLHQARRFLTFLVPFATTVEGEARTLITRLATPYLTHLEADLTQSRPGTRARIVQLFGLLGDTSARAVLRRHLQDPSRLVTFTAFCWLSRRGTPADTVALINHIDQLSDVDVSQLSSSLVHLGSAAAPTLRTHLQSDDLSTVARVVCAETLRWLGDADAAPLAVRLLDAAPPPELAAALLRLLRRVGCPEHAPRVRAYCDSDVSFVRIHAARALGQIGHPDQDRPRLRRMVTGADDRSVAFNAAKSLTELGQTTPLHHLSQTPHDRASLAASILQEPQ